jgi:hypothetical protein
MKNLLKSLILCSSLTLILGDTPLYGFTQDEAERLMRNAYIQTGNKCYLIPISEDEGEFDRCMDNYYDQQLLDAGMDRNGNPM